VDSKEATNGSGKSECSTEEIAAVKDSKEHRLALEVRFAEQLLKTLQMANGTKSNVLNQSGEMMFFLKPHRMITCQFQESKFTQLSVRVMDVVVKKKARNSVLRDQQPSSLSQTHQ
jgi:NCAIR mutase (PurE)-related protein